MTESASTSGLHAFAFQTGEWRVRHRKLRARLVGSRDWDEFDGVCRAWELLGGAGNIDDHRIDDPNGSYVAATLRRYDPAQERWSIWWVDPRLPRVDPPVHGRFNDGVGTFLNDDELRGLPIIVRFTWSEITPDRARWEQAFSPDAGASWEVNWIMHFHRTG
jgi:hypothetical protein